jgi:diguanylate cyclase (GGDEF)-like protein/PAS domain S-box-containing protein
MTTTPRLALADDERLARVRAYRVAEGRADTAFEDLVRRAIAAATCPVGWLALFEEGGERLCASVAAPFRRLLAAADSPFLARAACETLVIADLAQDAGPRGAALLAGAAPLRFYAAVPLRTPDGLVVGALSVADRIARELRPAERTALENLAAIAVARLESRRAPVIAPASTAGPLAVEFERLNALLEDEIVVRREAEAGLRREKEFSEAVLQSLPGAFYLVSRAGELLRWNTSFHAATGYAESEVATLHPLDFIAPRDRAAVEAAIREVFDTGAEVSLEAEMVDKAGNVFPYLFTGKPLTMGGETYLIGIGRDITLKKRAEQQMLRAKERLDLALTSSNLALWDWDLAAHRAYYNEGWAAILGESRREATFSESEVREWTHPGDEAVFEAALANAIKGVSESFDCEYRIQHSSGDWLWVHSRGKVTLRDAAGQALRMTGTSTDITKRKLAEERAEFLATRDALTRLPNRVLLNDRLEQAITNGARSRTGLAFMFIDLDRFKTINDSLGHQVGDELLKGVARRLETCIRASDTVARLGGDEFAVILENLRDDDDEGAQQVAEKMIAAMAAPMLIDNQHLNTSCSIGISLYPVDGRDSATLMKHADVAMYYAKEKGRNNYQFFSAQMNERAQERLAIENYLRLALRRNELLLHYQPRIDIAGGNMVGVEALIRWQHPRRGLLGPGKFIGVAEDSGLIVPIGEWVLENACQQAREWQRTVAPELRISVNLSMGQVVDGDRLFAAVERSLAASGIPPATLELELTESLLMQNIDEKAALLNRLAALGVGLAIDDFGTGYSSLSYLKKLPVDAIKIDSSFVQDIDSDPNDEAIIRAILAMAHSLRLKVVAEGVETGAQFARLKELGCDEYQGYFTSPPLPVAEFEARYAAPVPR